MKAVILAGGLGTRLSEETVSKPKPMVDIGGRPILWHIMKHYSTFGVNEFVICLGYKGYLIKEYFANYMRHTCDVTMDFAAHTETFRTPMKETWKVHLVDTGLNSMTGGRIKRVSDYVKNDECFCLTYGDGVTDVNVHEQLKFHRDHGKLATLLAVQPPGRFGALRVQDSKIVDFKEKQQSDGDYINGGFFVLSPKVLNFIEDDATIWERGPMEKLTDQGQLMAMQHNGFWQCMDTLRDKNLLEQLWASGEAPWKVWHD